MFLEVPFRAVNEKEEADEIITEAVNELKAEHYVNGKWYADYIRLRMRAVKA